MNTIQKMINNHDNPEFLQNKGARNGFFKLRSDVKVGFELTASIDFNQIADSVSNMANSVQSTFSDGV